MSTADLSAASDSQQKVSPIHKSISQGTGETTNPSGPGTEGTTYDGARQGASVTNVTLLQGVNNSVQLGLEINGQFSYPFEFATDREPTNDIKISAGGLITGTPTQLADQNLKVTIRDSNGKTVATYSILLHVARVMKVMLGPDAITKVAAADKSAKTPDNRITVDPIYAGGDTVRGTVRAEAPSGNDKVSSDDSSGDTSPATQGGSARNSVSANSSGATQKDKPSTDAITHDKQDPSATVAISSNLSAKASKPPAIVAVDGRTHQFTYQLNAPLSAGDSILVSSSSSRSPTEIVVQTPPKYQGEELRAIVGYQQAGASSSDFEQNWFTDFYISRPLNFHVSDRTSEPKNVLFRGWGNVRVASFPQPGNQTVSQLAGDFAGQLGAVKLNQLAQGAEFLSGIEFQPWRTFPLRGRSENSRQVFSLGVIAGFGATGFFSSPSHNVKVFQVPLAGSPQFPIFQKAYPTVTSRNVGFISPDIERFPKQYFAGLRLTTHYIDPTGLPLTSSPAMLAFTFGQNQVITGGKFTGVVGRIEAFYPLPFGNRGQTKSGAFSSLYLFGTTQMRLGRGSKGQPPIVLRELPDVPAFDSSVTLVETPSTRDVYRIGFGVDLVGLVSNLTGGGTKPDTAIKDAKKPPEPQTSPPSTPRTTSNDN